MRPLALAALAALGLAAGFGIHAQPSPDEPELALLRERDQRVAAVAWRLASANAELCPQTGPQAGLVLHDALQYGPELRPRARRFFGLHEGPAVLVTAPGGPAEAAGLARGDILMAVNGQAFAAPPAPQPDRRAASYAPLLEARRMLDAALAAGPARLSVRRGGQSLDLTLTPAPGCDFHVQLLPSDRVGASSDGRRVSITTALVALTRDDDELALVLGHEFAHNALGHPQRLLGGLAGRLGLNRRAVIAAEREADYVGLYFAERAGYDGAGAAAFWLRFGADHGDDFFSRWTHPASQERARAVGAAHAEIARKRAAGRPLTPERAAP